VNALSATHFQFPGQTAFYKGKVRDVYSIGADQLIIVACDRISAFDFILPKSIPFKGQILTEVASLFLDLTQDIIPNWKQSQPDPHVTIGRKCEPIAVEFVVRGYLTGHAWREYKSGKRMICGVPMPEGMVENEAFATPILTPATKAETGHDEDISYEDIVARGIVEKTLLDKLYQVSLALFHRGTEFAAQRGLILVDTKYEFGLWQGEPMLIDEIHTPDSSRYFYADTYQDCLTEGKPQRQLSKEFVREWLIGQGFQGREGDQMPEMSNEWVDEISLRYQELYRVVTGKELQKRDYNHIEQSIETSIIKQLQS
jgi:phosphoribosylaminoimidazole-succinocarboxamide synthase